MWDFLVLCIWQFLFQKETGLHKDFECEFHLWVGVEKEDQLARWREELKKLSYARFVVFSLAQDKTHKYAPFARMSDNSYPGK